MVVVYHQLVQIEVRGDAVHAYTTAMSLANQFQMDFIEVRQFGLLPESLNVLRRIVEIAEPWRQLMLMQAFLKVVETDPEHLFVSFFTIEELISKRTHETAWSLVGGLPNQE